MNAIEYTDFLTHHGIKNQKWGVRRYQNEDGSLTEEGKKRYGKTYGSSYGARVDIANNISQDFGDETRRLGGRVRRNSDEGDAISEKYDEYYNSVDKDPKFISDLKSRKEAYVKKGRDSDLAEYDALSEVIREHVPKELQARKEAFDKENDATWNDIKQFTDSQVKELTNLYKDAKISSGVLSKNYANVGEQIIHEAILDSIDADLNQYSYMSRHYDDYWINDRDSRNDLETRVKEKLNWSD